MANATALTINQLGGGTINTWTARPAGDVLDTGASAVTLYGTVDQYPHGRMVVEVFNGGTGALSVAALAGDNPPAQLSALGNATQSIGVGSAWIWGPFETGRFLQNDGTFGLTFTPSGTIAGTVRAYVLPNV